ncbi:hypothetical protein [Nocardia pseudovaccinii]|uniref:hypothetical protein n=1 Tax=Nocardia pseudovaccinii TaxID=189540 RepID=UPI0007A4ED61|nr:hypothetical protein [Nocardia pseudovaccinii]
MTSKQPTWTRGRLAATLGECYGRTPTGKVDVTAVAAAFKRAPSTVRKWLRGTDDQPSAMPAARLRELTTGGPRTEREAVGKADYAREAIARIALPKDRGINPQWRQQEWLDAHFVLLIQIYDRPWRQLLMTKRGNAADQARKRGEVIDQVVVPTKFHGDVLIHEVMAHQAAWAVRPPKNALSVGRGQVWADDAPEIDLSVLAVELGLAVDVVHR